MGRAATMRLRRALYEYDLHKFAPFKFSPNEIPRSLPEFLLPPRTGMLKEKGKSEMYSQIYYVADRECLIYCLKGCIRLPITRRRYNIERKSSYFFFETDMRISVTVRRRIVLQTLFPHKTIT